MTYRGPSEDRRGEVQNDVPLYPLKRITVNLVGSGGIVGFSTKSVNVAVSDRQGRPDARNSPF
jgi:hypothetical protein